MSEHMEHRGKGGELRIAQNALDDTRRQYDAIIQSAMDAIITTDEKQRILIFNRAAERVFGCSMEQAFGQRLERFIPERFRAGHAEHIRRFGATGATERKMGALGEIFGLRANGEEFPIEASISKVEVGNKKLFTVILRDVSEKHQAETNRLRLAAIVESTESAILSKDMKGIISTWNKGAEKLYGWREDEVLGKHITVIIPPELHAEQEEFLREISCGNVVRREETLRLRKDGSRVYISLTISPVRNATGKIVGASTIAHDVTARKLAEEKAEQYTQELQRSNAELEQFAYVASHDLQEPLRMVASYTELLAERYRGKLDENADKFIGYAIDGARRMQRLIRDLLAYARVSSQAQPLQPTDSSAILASVLTVMHTAIEISKAEVVVQQLPEVMADEVQLSQVFQNLIGNALKFHGAEAPRIQIRAEDSGGTWKFSVSDNGIGMEMENSGRIFEMFQRLHGREEYEGTGIGLTISKRIIDRHGGRIWFDSMPGRGTTFYFTLPRVEQGGQEHAYSSAAGGR